MTAKRALGIDYGMKRIGVAISDERKVLASAIDTLTTARKTEQSAKILAEAIQKWETERSCTIDQIVVGIPLKLSGKSSMMADEVREFISLLSEKTDAEIITWDERLSTVQAERAMREANLNRKKRSKVIDQNTAVVILQSYLDTQGHSWIPTEF